jgi:putative ABC transport system permease protein
MPGVQSAALATRAPLDSSTPTVRVSAREAVAPAADATAATVSFLVISPSYFDVVRTPIVSGRAFAARDDAGGVAAVIVNETLAARLWPNGDAIGRRLWLDPQVAGTASTVVGIARNSKYLTLGEEGQGHLYLPLAQHPRSGMALLVRSSEPTDRLASAVLNALRSIDPNLQGFFTRTLTEHVGVSLLPIRLAAQLATVVAALALALAVVGLYSLVSYLVAERTHEIGVRMALGADASEVMRLVIGQGVKLALAGLALGVPTALVFSRVLGSLLYGVSPTDPVVFAAVSTGILIVAVLACYAPARRATRLDPIAALRQS